jgi:hypothetical protein
MRHVLIVGGIPSDRFRAARRYVPDTHKVLIVDSATMPFVLARDLDWPPPPRVVVIEEIERAFPDSQSGGTRLVLTQSTYLLQTWIDRLDENDLIVATADRAALERCAPEFMQARGCWSAFEIVELDRGLGLEAGGSLDGTLPTASPQSLAPSPIAMLLARAFSSTDPDERLRLCREALALAPESAVACLALASAYRETRDGTAARDALDRAASLAPEWEGDRVRERQAVAGVRRHGAGS